jgi:hypothetical protein
MLKILGTTAQNLVARITRRPELYTPGEECTVQINR